MGKPGDKPEIQPTLDGRIAATVPGGAPPGTQPPAMPDTQPPAMPADTEPALGTMRMPAGGVLPATSAPPAMPADWRYTIHAEIARGGMGRVVEATDTVLGRTVALKEALSLDADTVRRFQREVKITARLEHPSIVPVHDAGTSPVGSPYYVMRKVSGRPLEALVGRADHLNARLALVPHIVAAAHAIAHAHERGIVHRDIKPPNILVGDAGETIVIDWGLAKSIGEAEEPAVAVQRMASAIGSDDDELKTRAGIVFGTPGFMAPEQLRGKPVDERCDVYALGATLYHLLARKPPHHDKNPDVMMRAAVDGPPQPLREIVEGVPPELATIVDKALAHDPARRYQHAGALAEDLQRFLTGQLVASHYYTPRERVVRFLRKHRAAVGIAVASVLALLILAFIFVQQIRGERDRADEQAKIAVVAKRKAEEEREKALRNARELTLGNAQHLSITNPTRATAMVKQLVDSELWRHARDVGAASSVHGAAFSLPASQQTQTLELSRDGQRALAAGNDGIVRIYELGKRDIKVVADMGGAVNARFADGERKLVLFQGNRLTIVDLASGVKRDVPIPTAIAKLEVSGPIAFWVDPANAVWKLDLAAGAPARVEVGEQVTTISPSPDGRWIALAGRQQLLLVDRSSPTLPPEVVTEGEALKLTWSGDSKDLVALFDDEIIDVRMAPSPSIYRRLMVGQRYSVAISGDRIFSAGPQGVELMFKDGTKMRAPGSDHNLGVYEGRDRVVISAKPLGEIVVLSDLGDHTLQSPEPITLVATSANGPWIVAAVADRLLVWSLDAIEPRVVATKQPSSARFVTGDHLIITYVDDTAEWLDLRTHKTVALGALPTIHTVVSAPDGADAIIIDSTRHALRVAGVGKPQELEGEVSAAAFVDNVRFVVAIQGGLRLEDQRVHTRLVLLAHGPEARGLAATAADGGWVVAAFADGRIWRKNLKSGATTELKLPPLTAGVPLAIAGDGTVVLAAGGQLRAWSSDGAVRVLLEKPVADVAFAEPATVLAVTDQGAIYLTDLKHPAGAPVATEVKNPSLARAGGLVAASSANGGVEVIDPLAKWRWPIASAQKGQPPYSFVEIAPDGSRVVATTPNAVLVWTLALPASAAETKRWLDTITNAVADSPSGPLGWH